MSELPEKIPLIILNSSESPFLFMTHHTRYMVYIPYFLSFEWEYLVIDTCKGEYLILEFDFINHFNPSIDWRKGLIVFNPDYKDSGSSFIPLSNVFSTTCAALVGDSRTPSIPTSVCILSMNSPQ
ncbi:hypothetical protein O181_048839 [Austropuccinia psidii MF-1]|uniref:Uncharacterized protein n=1 Tax=Austropuccinia psidii MF-1 TaxID=1389203 RepID=A0A9Q3HN96_9BASI|nr:hypothetical protein [Austropuccinia psidii MF-1]